ncbi:ATP-binding cassette subfamily C protein CydC/ATP-binding cassette subfamily C protein CydCD [Knoellia remsis]|uniref:ATP-binding cassette subfamily C protein CydC/ATP-binding cassette subfamily C protein CydCD n=1 Tax=Knoellia remsis TaxID=407159 RepID=A0A2T0UCY1_9MICO|nr:ATP-binding cassette domain-containing protein [Knoellia remsis]PRY55667.1 ATP-binding cassette subfamily C protein CydC/ATP-binding cassette subfamily C protein CydCD [Knoellia remsis]
MTTLARGRTDLLAGLWGGLALSSGVALTATSGWLIVRAAERPVILTLLMAIVSVRAFGMARPFFRYLERLRSHDRALDDLARDRTDVYAALIPLTPARLGRRSRSAVLTGVVNDLTDVVESQVRVRVPVLAAALTLVFATVLAGALLPVAGGVIAVWALVTVALHRWGLGLERGAQPVVGAARAEVGRAADLVARHTAQLQAIGAEGEVLARLDRAQDDLARALRRQSRGRALVTGGVLGLTGIACVVMAALAVRSDLGAPVMALLVVVPAALADTLLPLADAARAQARAEEAQSRVDALLDQEPAVAAAREPSRTVHLGEIGTTDAHPGTSPTVQLGEIGTTDAHPGTSPTVQLGEFFTGETDPKASRAVQLGEIGTGVPHLRLAGVTAGWVDGRRDVGPVDLDLPPGRRVAVVGANGSGKSTLLAVLARALDPSAGRYLVDGTDATGLGLEEVRGLVAVVDDEPHLFAADVRANLVLAAPDADDTAILAALHVAGLDGWFATLPDGLDTGLGAGGRGVSGGERTRIALARAVLSGRPVILLDEPVAQLDHATATAVMRDVWSATEGRSVVLVSHRAEGLDGVDEVIDLTADSPTSASSAQLTAASTPKDRP